jgi:hypothetical protein
MTTDTTPPALAAAQAQFLSTVRQGQSAVVEGVRTWVEAVAKVAPPAPLAGLPGLPDAALPDGMPTPAALVASTFDFAEELLAAQREFVQDLVAGASTTAGG